MGQLLDHRDSRGEAEDRAVNQLIVVSYPCAPSRLCSDRRLVYKRIEVVLPDNRSIPKARARAQ